jgi:hypothetical protein
MLFDSNIDTVEEVLAIRAKAKEALLAGATVVSWSVEGSSVNKVISLSPKEVMIETAKFLKAVDPDTYGRTVKRIVPIYL